MTLQQTRQEELLKALIEKKEQEGITSESDFAKRLGITRSIWSHTKNGRRGVTPSLCQAILRTYPDLTHIVIAYLRDGEHETI